MSLDTREQSKSKKFPPHFSFHNIWWCLWEEDNDNGETTKIIIFRSLLPSSGQEDTRKQGAPFTQDPPTSQVTATVTTTVEAIPSFIPQRGWILNSCKNGIVNHVDPHQKYSNYNHILKLYFISWYRQKMIIELSWRAGVG